VAYLQKSLKLTVNFNVTPGVRTSGSASGQHDLHFSKIQSLMDWEVKKICGYCINPEKICGRKISPCAIEKALWHLFVCKRKYIYFGEKNVIPEKKTRRKIFPGNSINTFNILCNGLVFCPVES
jgi:hypothetical protein